MSDRLPGPAEPSTAGLRRLDERLGLAVSRAGTSPRTLVTYARDHVSVRTPSRPDFRDGNTLDLEAVPGPEALAGWVDRFETTTGRLGVRHVQLRWETPLAADAPPQVPTADPALVEAAADLDLQLEPTTILLLAELAPSVAAPAQLVPVPPPTAVPRERGAGVEVRSDDTPVEVERRWHAIGVLDRYATGDAPEQWRAADGDFAAWTVDVHRELADAGRATPWLALRHGTPVGKAVLLHDRQGLAAIEDVVVHPVHRRKGIASALVAQAVATHLAVEPGSRIGIGAEPAGPADHLYRRLGFRPHATVWTVLRS